jgi:hypothetical protein
MCNDSFLVVWLIGIRPGKVSYHDQVQVQGLKGREEGKVLKEALLGVLGRV